MTAIRLELGYRIASITLDQPDRRANVLSTALWRELGDAVAAVAAHADARGLVIASAKNGIFLAGADLMELYTLPTDNPEPVRAFLNLGHSVLNAIESLPMPTVAAIDGACLGGGLEVALACDFRLAGTHPKVKIGLPEVKLGLIPGWGGTQRLPRLLGLQKGAELLTTGRSLSADEAKTIGLIDSIVPSESLVETAAQIALTAKNHDWSARRLKKRSPIAIEDLDNVRTKVDDLPDDERMAAEAALSVIERGSKLPLEQATSLETEAFAPLLGSPAARRRIESFLNK